MYFFLKEIQYITTCHKWGCWYVAQALHYYSLTYRGNKKCVFLRTFKAFSIYKMLTSLKTICPCSWSASGSRPVSLKRLLYSLYSSSVIQTYSYCLLLEVTINENDTNCHKTELETCISSEAAACRTEQLFIFLCHWKLVNSPRSCLWLPTWKCQRSC